VVAVVGATGAVGGEMIRQLEERGFPVEELVPLASERSLGRNVSYLGDELPVEVLDEHSFEGVDLALFSAGAEQATRWAPFAVSAGATVIDNSSAFRGDPDIPLVVPEVNPAALDAFRHPGIIANPNCSTIQLVVALAPLHREAGLSRVVVSTYQAVSGAGQRALDELVDQTRKLLGGLEAEAERFPRQIAFNLFPQIDQFVDHGETKEERKMRDETRRILGLPELPVSATCVRVPVLYGHSESVWAHFERPLSAEAAKQLLRQAPGVMLYDQDQEYPTAIEAAGTDATLVGRVRPDLSDPQGLCLWVVADNLRKGAATNAVQIAEIVVRDHLG
jgi:aspartate-semialdehyde dehydrogenase